MSKPEHQLSASNVPRVRSEPGLDLYRGMIVVMMFAVHARRLEAPRRPPAGVAELVDSFFDRMLWLEPYIAASFLFVAGFSLVLSQKHGKARGARPFVAKIARRALGLWALSVVLFVPQYGLALPDLIVSSGILSAIALSILLVGAALSLGRPKLWLGVIAGSVLAVTAWLDGSGRTISGVNAGPGGAFPLVSFAATGALLGLIYVEREKKAFSGFVLGSIAPSAIAAFGELRWLTERTSHYSHQGLTAISEILHGRPGVPTDVTFWNHSAIGAVGLSAPLCLTLFVFLSSERKLAEHGLLAPLLLLGRHALFAYVLHLGILGIVDLCGLDPTSPLQTLGLVLGLVLLSSFLAGARERLTAKHNFGRGLV